MNLREFHSDHPYPETTVAGKNPAYARAMLSNCAGRNSEMSAVALYFYDHIITERDALLSSAFRAIMKVEMVHLELFEKLALHLGADPRLWEAQTVPQPRMNYWSPARLPYATNRKLILQNALAAERAAIAIYERQQKEIQDEGVVNVLRRVLLDEQLHVELFRALLEQPQPS
ncbi:MAG: rubrerythrin family protein [Oscillospiraceae bacterium]|jgi:bacterioferritin|nr:rubrerythrin family protein [Oscillospiraceae bacterium]